MNRKQVSRTIRLFLGGDYAFLTSVYGHRGANCMQFCLWCTEDLKQKRVSPTEPLPWQDKSLIDNEENDPVFPFPLDRVVVLPPHIVLGLTKDFSTISLEM